MYQQTRYPKLRADIFKYSKEGHIENLLQIGSD